MGRARTEELEGKGAAAKDAHPLRNVLDAVHVEAKTLLVGVCHNLFFRQRSDLGDTWLRVTEGMKEGTTTIISIPVLSRSFVSMRRT